MKMIISENQNISDIENYINFCENENINSVTNADIDKYNINVNVDNYKIKKKDSYSIINTEYKYNNIGFINLGATCYINSLLQILYHIEEFRESILYCDVVDEEQNVLNEISIIYFSLKSYKDKYYNPISFIKNYENEIIDINHQQDVHEFMLNLIDKLENRLKNTKNENLMKYFFQLTLNEKRIFKYDSNH